MKGVKGSEGRSRYSRPRATNPANPVFLAENFLKTSQKHRFMDGIRHNIFTKF